MGVLSVNIISQLADWPARQTENENWTNWFRSSEEPSIFNQDINIPNSDDKAFWGAVLKEAFDYLQSLDKNILRKCF